MEPNEKENEMMVMIKGAVTYQRYYLSLDLVERKRFDNLFAEEFNKAPEQQENVVKDSETMAVVDTTSHVPEVKTLQSPATVAAGGDPAIDGAEPAPFMDVIENWKCLNGAGCKSTEYISGRDSLGNKFTKCTRCGDIQLISEDGKCNG